VGFDQHKLRKHGLTRKGAKVKLDCNEFGERRLGESAFVSGQLSVVRCIMRGAEPPPSSPAGLWNTLLVVRRITRAPGHQPPVRWSPCVSFTVWGQVGDLKA
jgi:hypothetical protein